MRKGTCTHLDLLVKDLDERRSIRLVGRRHLVVVGHPSFRVQDDVLQQLGSLQPSLLTSHEQLLLDIILDFRVLAEIFELSLGANVGGLEVVAEVTFVLRGDERRYGLRWRRLTGNTMAIGLSASELAYTQRFCEMSQLP